MTKTNPYRVQKVLGIVFTGIGAAFLIAAALIAAMSMEEFREINADKDLVVVCIVVGVNGLVFFLLGLPFAVYESYRRRLAARLTANGRKIIAEVEEVRPYYYLKYDRQCPYVIQCGWKNPDDGKTYHFRSAPVWFNPAKVLQDKQITSLPVYADPMKLRKYHVSLDGIEGNDVYL